MRYGLIGTPLSHSYSPEIHRFLGLPEYGLKELSPAKLPDFLQKREFDGINVTIPYKKEVFPYLDEIDPDARAIGAVNTVVNRRGRLIGYNTDLMGVKALCRHAGISLQGKRVVILGSGGTAATARTAARQGGAGEILTVSRQEKPGCITYRDLADLPMIPTVLINTTPVGMFPQTDSSPLPELMIPGLCGVLDAVYRPLRTKLVLQAQKNGIPAESGLYMLAAQAVASFVLFTDQPTEDGITDEVYRFLRRTKENIVLIGMPSSGKTTVAELLGKRTGRPVMDTDRELVNRLGMPISRFFAEKGEKGFRQEESALIREWAGTDGYIIATGGGTVLDPDNVAYLRQNGRLIRLDRSPALLTPSADRPLVSDRERLKRLYEERLPLYRSLADETVVNDGTPQQAAEQIIRMWNE